MSEYKRKSLKEKLPPEALEHMKAAREEMRKSMETILPPGFMDHRRTARKEMVNLAHLGSPIIPVRIRCGHNDPFARFGNNTS